MITMKLSLKPCLKDLTSSFLMMFSNNYIKVSSVMIKSTSPSNYTNFGSISCMRVLLIYHLMFLRYIGAVHGERIVQELENNLPKGNKDEFLGIYLELLAESSEIMKQLTKSINKTPDLKLIEQYG